MRSAGVTVFVKSVEETVAVQLAPGRARLSVTVTVPRLAVAVPPTVIAPRSAPAGALIDRMPVTTATVALQAGLVVPLRQLLPGAAEVTVLAMILSPVSGSSTVAEYVMVTLPPLARSPVQVRSGLEYDTLPAVAA